MALLTLHSLEREREERAAGDRVLRIALGLWAADARATITDLQRQWVISRLAQPEDGQWRPFGVQEKARIQEPLLDYIAEYRPRILDIVLAQFCERRSA